MSSFIKTVLISGVCTTLAGWAMPSLHGGLLEINFTAPLNDSFKKIDNDK